MSTRAVYIIQELESGNWFFDCKSKKEAAEQDWQDDFHDKESGRSYLESRQLHLDTFEEYTLEEFLEYCVKYGIPKHCKITIASSDL